MSYIGSGLDLAAYAGPELIGASVLVAPGYGWTYAQVAAYQLIEVSNTKKILFEWDLTNAGGFAWVYQFGSGYLHSIASGGSGAVSLTLEPGALNEFGSTIEVGILPLQQGNGVFGSGFVRISNVPLPGSIALLGVGHFSIRNRRRHK